MAKPGSAARSVLRYATVCEELRTQPAGTFIVVLAAAGGRAGG